MEIKKLTGEFTEENLEGFIREAEEEAEAEIDARLEVEYNRFEAERAAEETAAREEAGHLLRAEFELYKKEHPGGETTFENFLEIRRIETLQRIKANPKVLEALRQKLDFGPSK